MKHSCLVAALVAGCLLGAVSPVGAYVFPSARDYGYAGDWGDGVPYQPPNPYLDIAAQQRLQSQQATMQQNMVVQSGIRNTLTSQAEAQNSAMLNQRQANRDWWFQNQAQQMARQRSRQYGSPAAPSAAGFGFEVPQPPKASLDIIKWPLLLQEPTFASRRTLIEAPYRRSPPGLSAPTAQDYRNMVQTVEQMKGILFGLAQEGVDASQYNQAEAFLNQLQQEARARSEAGGSSPQSKSQ